MVSYYELGSFLEKKGERRKPSKHENLLPQLPDLHRCEQASLRFCLHCQEQLKMPHLPHQDRLQPEAASPNKPFLLKLLPVRYLVKTKRKAIHTNSHQYPQLISSFPRPSKKIQLHNYFLLCLQLKLTKILRFIRMGLGRVLNSCCAWRGSGFGSQHLPGSPQPSVALVLGSPVPSPGLPGHQCACALHKA